jgi:hypothetical protein
LKQEIAEYRADLRNTVSEERQDRIRDLIRSRSDIE